MRPGREHNPSQEGDTALAAPNFISERSKFVLTNSHFIYPVQSRGPIMRMVPAPNSIITMQASNQAYNGEGHFPQNTDDGFNFFDKILTQQHHITTKEGDTCATVGRRQSFAMLPVPGPAPSASRVVATSSICDKRHHIEEEALQRYDIICGRCSTAFNNIGNRRFRVTIMQNVKKYIDAATRADKKVVITSIVNLLINEAGARFLKRKKSGGFMEVTKTEIRNKVQQ